LHHYQSLGGQKKGVNLSIAFTRSVGEPRIPAD